MTANDQKLIDLLRFSTDDEYFQLDEEQRFALEDALLDRIDYDSSSENAAEAPPRLLLGGPKRIALKHGSIAPVLLGYFHTGLRAWRLNFDPNLYLFLKNHASGNLQYCTPLISMRRGPQPRPSGVGDPPDRFEAASTRTGVVVIDLLDKLSGKLESGPTSLTAVAGDTRSNTIEVTFENDASIAHEERTITPGVSHSLNTRSNLESNILVPQTASLGDGLIIAVTHPLQSDAGVSTSSGQSLMAGHIILVRADEHPVVVPVTVPVSAVMDAAGRHRFNVEFSIDLATGESLTDPGDYQVYLDLGAEFAGPYPMTLTE